MTADPPYDVLSDLASWNPTWRADGTGHLIAQAIAEIERLRADNEAMERQIDRRRKVTLRAFGGGTPWKGHVQ